MAEIQTYDYSASADKAILWQYDNAENLQSLISNMQAFYDANHAQFWSDWYADIFDLRTANDFGLAVWAIILDFPINVPLPPATESTFGFGEYHKNFDRGNFAQASLAVQRLGTENARLALRLKAFKMFCSGTVPEINRILADVFSGYGKCWLNDGLDMTQAYTFEFVPPSELLFLFDNYDLLPRPAGVESEYRILINESWGFGDNHENFNNGNFSEG